MRIIIEGTEKDQYSPPRITIEVEKDDLTLEQVLFDLIRPALIGHGFSTDLVEETFNKLQSD